MDIITSKLTKKLHDKLEELEKAVTVGEYYAIQIQINEIKKILKNYNNG